MNYSLPTCTVHQKSHCLIDGAVCSHTRFVVYFYSLHVHLDNLPAAHVLTSDNTLFHHKWFAMIMDCFLFSFIPTNENPTKSKRFCCIMHIISSPSAVHVYVYCNHFPPLPSTLPDRNPIPVHCPYRTLTAFLSDQYVRTHSSFS